MDGKRATLVERNTLRWSQRKGCLFVCCRDSRSQLDLLQGDSFIICALGTTISDCSNNNNPLYRCKAAPLPIQRCQPLALDSDFSFILVKRQDRFCIIAPCCMLKMTPSLHTCLGFFFLLFFDCWRLHNILIRQTAHAGHTHGVKVPLKPLEDLEAWRILS